MDTIDTLLQYSHNFKLLYVEDNEEARRSTLELLDEFFTDIVIGVDGVDGVEKFQQHKIDLIVTDINMPRLNGLEMAKKIKEINKSVPILVLSAHNESSFFIEGIKLGIDGYILKPLDVGQLVNELYKIVSKLRAFEEAKESSYFLEQYQEIADNSSIVSKTDSRGIITYVNDKFCDISGYAEDELIGKNHNIIRHPDNPKLMYKEMWDSIKGAKEIWNGVVRNQAKDGSSYYVKSTIKPILDADENIIEYIALRDDITDIMNPKKQLDDAVKNSKEPLVVYMKLEEFSIIEELYDTQTMEELQDKVAINLKSSLPDGCKFDRIYRLDNGEYAMVSERSKCLEDSDAFFQRLRTFQKTVKECVVNIGEVDYDVSIIISIAYENTNILESAKLGIKTLLRTKQIFIVANNFAQIQRDKAYDNMQVLSMVKTAIHNFKIVSYFQPIINNKTREIEKYESLVRLINEEGKVLSPFFFLDISKKGKYYLQITNMVLDNSFRALENTDMDISINLSAIDIESKVIREKIFELLYNHKDDASRVVFELLEDENIRDFDLIKDFIEKAKSLGVKIAIDDFGAGYSNFERLLDYQPDILKIDGSLIKDINVNGYSLSIVKTIVSFAKEQNIQIVAEFVESEDIYNILSELDIEYSQGYFFGKPEPLQGSV
ncbi:MAG: EAL domain-containing protein [Epsilonproteobacteria bacterium]|nr:EAL domain-containing protein [Campylobacterota bacterium]